METALQFLADPTFFAGFAIIIGVAYVLVWVISLKEIVQPDTGFLDPEQRGEPRFDFDEFSRRDIQPRRDNRPRRNTVRVQRKTLTAQQQAQQERERSRRARVTRAA